MRYLRVNPGQHPDYIIVGLGNPGSVYENTRQNVGFKAIEYVETLCALTSGLKRNFQYSMCDKCLFDGCLVYIAKPSVQISNSGLSVSGFLQYYDLPPDRLIVIREDVNIPLGQIQLDFSSNDCGHKGIRSIQQYIGNKKIKQILIGVGMVPDDMNKTEYLLSNFNEEEEKVLSEVYKFVFKAIFCLFNYSIDLVRDKFNHVMKTLDYEKYTRKFQAR